jgi:hypothetical protein
MPTKKLKTVSQNSENRQAQWQNPPTKSRNHSIKTLKTVNPNSRNCRSKPRKLSIQAAKTVHRKGENDQSKFRNLSIRIPEDSTRSSQNSEDSQSKIWELQMKSPKIADRNPKKPLKSSAYPNR